MRASRILALAASLATLAPTGLEAQASGPGLLRLAPGDTVRLWRVRPRLQGWVGVVLGSQTPDSLVVGSGPAERYEVEVSSLYRVEVRRTEVTTAVVGGIVTGLIAGALVGGAVGYCGAGGCSGGDTGYPPGTGAIVGAQAGATLGALVLGALGTRERPRGRWVTVPLSPR